MRDPKRMASLMLLAAGCGLILALAGACARGAGGAKPADSAPAAAGKAASQPAPPQTPAEIHADKSHYTLFNPTPPDQMREFNTDRPDATESPFTVDAGHYQLEMSLFELSRENFKGERTNDLSLIPFNLKAGLTNDLDLQLIINPYHRLWLHAKGESKRNEGFGETELRAKYNLWGNDGGDTAGAVMPFVRFPTGTDGLSNHHVEGGLILPLAVSLPAGFNLGLMAEFDADRNTRNDGYGLDFVHTATVHHKLTERLDAYVEYAGVAPAGTGNSYLSTFDTGLIYALRKNVQLDAGVNLGLSDRADNILGFLGISFRW